MVFIHSCDLLTRTVTYLYIKFMPYEAKPLSANGSTAGLSEKAINIHHDKLYVGYVNKKNEIDQKLSDYLAAEKFDSANQTYSDLRALKDGETFAVNGVYLHEWYFAMLGGKGEASGTLADALIAQFGSVEKFLKYFAACGMAARGWVVLAWDTQEQMLKIYSGDAHNQGGVWGALPIIVLDVYEHAYFIDYGSDRKAYINAFLQQLDWQKANEFFVAATARGQK